eukprot:COSAG04_NODE_793_length_10270_cov_26.952807_5_plen_92_part_00
MFAAAAGSAAGGPRQDSRGLAEMASPTYVPRLVTTGWGRALMATPIIGHAVGAFANAYAGIVGAELKKCECSPRPQMLRPRPAHPRSHRFI